MEVVSFSILDIMYHGDKLLHSHLFLVLSSLVLLLMALRKMKTKLTIQ